MRYPQRTRMQSYVNQSMPGAPQIRKGARLNLKDNQFTEYLLPRSTNVRRVFVQDDAPEPIVWIGNNHGASIVKVEPLQQG